MIDTIQLRLLDYKIRQDNSLTIYPSPYQIINGYIVKDNEMVLYESKEFVLVGSKAVYNNDLINFDIKQFNNDVLCSVHFSAPKIKSIGDNNFNSINKNDLIDIAIDVEKQLKLAGIDVNIKKAKLSRIDLFKNVKTKFNIIEYKDIFELFNMKRQNEIVNRSYYTTFYKGNKSRMLVIYDKVNEMKVKGKDIDIKDNIIRFELRHFKNKNINNYINCDSYNDLIDNFDNINGYYNEYLRGLFKDIRINNNDLLSYVDYFVNNEYGFSNYIRHIGYLQLSNIDIDKLKYLLVNKFNYSKGAVSQIIDKINKAKILHNKIKNNSLIDKYNELRGLLLAS